MSDDLRMAMAWEWRSIKPGDVFTRGRNSRKFKVQKIEDERLTVIGECVECKASYVFTLDPRNPKPQFPSHCMDHRKLAYRAAVYVRLRGSHNHEIEPRRATLDRWSRGDIIERGGHLYLVTDEAAERVYLSCVCSYCGKPFSFSRPVRGSKRDLRTLTRRCCDDHASSKFQNKRPVAWAGDVLRAVARQAGMSVEELICVGTSDAADQECDRRAAPS